MGGLTTERFKNLSERALEPLHKSIDEVKKSIATANSNYYQPLTKIPTYETLNFIRNLIMISNISFACITSEALISLCYGFFLTFA